jgi:uncharacterized BrkB/YihY/UPF0761 family membrane protein
MSDRERALQFFLRMVGAVMGLALIALFMPRAWMAWCHEQIGLGAFPDAPIAEYLARGTSGLCALVGGLFWLMSRRPAEHRTLIRYVAVGMAALAVILGTYAVRMGIPASWALGDSAGALVTAIVILVLQGRRRAAA